MKKHVTPIPPNVKQPGLKIRCTHCDTYVTNTCLENNRNLGSCSHPENLEYRSVIHLPKSKHGRKVKTHKTTNLSEAIIEHLKFRDAVKNEMPLIETSGTLSIKQEQLHPDTTVQYKGTLPEWAARFVAHMRDVDTPKHLQQNLSSAYLAEIDREMKRLCVCLAKHVDIRAFDMQHFDDTAVGHVCDYLLETKKYANRTFNKHLTTYTMFYSWWLKKTRQNSENLFAKVQHRKTELDPQTIDSVEEFEAFIALLTPENGIVISKGKRKQKRILYRSWLEKAFRIGLESGVRRENLVHLKTSDIIEDASGPVVLRIENIKVNNIMKLSDANDKRLIYVPLTANLKNLIIADYESFKRTGIDNYLLAPETKNRRLMADDLSRAFSHYYRQLNTGKELKFGALRKKYITEMEIFTGGKAEEITGHSNDRVLKHYRVPQLIAKAAREFEVYPKENELANLRTKRSTSRFIER